MITTKADSRRRVVLPNAKPGQVYLVHDNPGGSFTLTVIKPAAPAAPKCRLVKRGGYTVVEPSQPINEQAIQDLLTDFPATLDSQLRHPAAELIT